MTWGAAIEDVTKGSETVIVRRGESFASQGGTAYYTFDKDGALVRGRYVFSERYALNRSREWSDVMKTFLPIRNELTTRYGASEGRHGNGVPYSAAAITKTGERQWSWAWNGIPTPDGETMAIGLRLWPDGVIELEYHDLYPNGSVKTEVDRELMPFTDPADIEVYLSGVFDVIHPADTVCDPMTLEDYIYGHGAWVFEHIDIHLQNLPEAVIKVHDHDGRILWIMDDADALMIEDPDGSITWVRYSDGPVDCVDMIRRLLPWARGQYPG